MKTLDMLKKAMNGGYGILALNFSTLEVLKGLVKAAEETNAPLMLAISRDAMSFIGPEYLKGMIAATRATTAAQISFHLDHGRSFEDIVQAIDIGCDSVMIDASSKPYEENIKLTKKVVDYAHARGIQVEAELGKLVGIEDHVNVAAGEGAYTDPDQALDFVMRTGIDSLAVAVGTSHGAYKFEGPPKLRFDILQKIQDKLPDTPLVLHGASTVNPKYINRFEALGGNLEGAQGVFPEIIKQAVKEYNVSKINSDTDLRLIYTMSMLEHITKNPNNIDPRKSLAYATEQIEKCAKEKILSLYGKNKAL
ncbi:MAG: class II fructose-bisphosphate aldolase family protein [Christensenellaceae bacterium]|jgi:fructose-bisphosphate aldolase class II|nr:class II fructose-bisphosphate aldolase family protein [Christensenellaceae bacterium]